MKTIEINGISYTWRQMLKLRREQRKIALQPTLFEDTHTAGITKEHRRPVCRTDLV